MMRTTLFRCATLMVVIGMAAPTRAVVVELSAQARSQVRSFIGGDQDSSDESMNVFGPESGLRLPISARAELKALGGEGEPEPRALARADFFDPARQTPKRNPEEITIEAGCFSDDSTTYQVDSSVVEERVIRLSAQDIGPSQMAQSAFFPSGAIFLWSLDADRDLTGVSAEVSFVVRRFVRSQDGTEQNSTIVLQETVSLSGGPGGTCLDETSPGITALSGDLTLLPDIPGLPLGDVSALGVACLSIIDETQQLDYEYEATAEEPFILEATVTVTLSNLSDGTGIFAAFGSFEEATNIIATAIPQATANAIQARVNRAIAGFEPQPPAVVPNAELPNPCGMLGFEVLPMLLLSLAFFVRSHPPVRL